MGFRAHRAKTALQDYKEYRDHLGRLEHRALLRTIFPQKYKQFRVLKAQLGHKVYKEYKAKEATQENQEHRDFRANPVCQVNVDLRATMVLMVPMADQVKLGRRAHQVRKANEEWRDFQAFPDQLDRLGQLERKANEVNQVKWDHPALLDLLARLRKWKT